MAYFEKVKLTDEDGNTINPSTEESIVLLRRMVKLMESQNATDIGNRQRVVVESAPSTAVTGTLTTVTTVTSVTNQVAMAGADQRQFIDVSRTNYNTGIRSKLTFS